MQGKHTQGRWERLVNLTSHIVSILPGSLQLWFQLVAKGYVFLSDSSEILVVVCMVVRSLFYWKLGRLTLFSVLKHFNMLTVDPKIVWKWERFVACHVFALGWSALVCKWLFEKLLHTSTINLYSVIYWECHWSCRCGNYAWRSL
jgi:hypothetical protein